MGTVYKAQNKNDNEWYAVKVLPRRSMWNVRIARRQVRQFEQCRHPSVVPFVDVGTAAPTTSPGRWLGRGPDILVQRRPLDPGTMALCVSGGRGSISATRTGHSGLLKPSTSGRARQPGPHHFDFGVPYGVRGRVAGRYHVHGQLADDGLITATGIPSRPTHAAGGQYSLGYHVFASRDVIRSRKARLSRR